MRLEFHVLDYFWKALLMGAVTSTIFFGLMLGLFLLFKNSDSMRLKWCFNFHYLFLLISLATSLMIVTFGDSELIAGCFNRFVETSSSLTLTRAIAGLWCVGFFSLIATDGVRYVLARRSLNSVPLDPNSNAGRQFQELTEQMGFHGNEVQLSSAFIGGSPFVHGLLRHEIVVPQEFLSAGSRADLKCALAHELIHVRDLDSLWLLLELFCRRLLFFHPLSYATARIFLNHLERAADEQAMDLAKIEPKDYIQSLIFAATLAGGYLERPFVMNVSRGFLETKNRILAIGKGQRARPWRWSAPILLLAPVFSMGLSVAEAGISLQRVPSSGAGMCTQVAHEKILEAWLRVEPVPNKCEK
jgi:beta-lactamase regulating signal transducer with metallopeptidase domain